MHSDLEQVKPKTNLPKPTSKKIGNVLLCTMVTTIFRKNQNLCYVDFLWIKKALKAFRSFKKQLFKLLMKNVAPCTDADSYDITDIDNANEELENVNVNLSDVNNGSNVQNEIIECVDQERINDEESPNTNSDVAPIPRRSTYIKLFHIV